MKYTKAINIKEREKAKERTKSRVGRRLFKGNQILALEKAFALNSYLTRTERAALAEKIVSLTYGNTLKRCEDEPSPISNSF